MDEHVFEELIRREHAGVYRAAARVFRQSEGDRAQDVAQTVFLRLLDGRLNLEDARHPGAVLRHYAVRLALEELRRSSSRRSREERTMAERNSTTTIMEASSEPSPAQSLAEKEAFDLLASELGRLDDEQRLPITLRFQEEWTFAEIGRELGCSEATAHARVNRGVETLRARMTRSRGAGGFAVTVMELESALASLPSPVVPSGLMPKLLALRSGASLGAGVGLASLGAIAAVVALTVMGLALLFPDADRPLEGEGESESVVRAEAEGPASSNLAEPETSGRVLIGSLEPSPDRESAETPPEDPVREPGAVVRGRFVDRNGAPLTELPIRLRVPGGKGGIYFRLDAKTTPTGEFEFVLSPAEREKSRRFDLLALPRERSAWSRPVIDLEQGEVRELGELRVAELSVAEVGHWHLELQITDESGAPIVGIQSLVFDVDHEGYEYTWNALAQGTSDEGGLCLLEGERVGIKRIVVDGRRQGFCRRVLEFTMLPGLARYETIALPVGLTLRGQVSDVQGLPVRGVVMNSQRIVEGKRVGFESALSAGISPDDGSFLIRGLDPGPLEIEFSGRSWSTARIIAEAGTPDLSVQLKRRDDLRDIGDHEAELHGEFVNAEGERIEIESWFVDVRSLSDDAIGRFENDVLPNVIWPMPRQIAMVSQTLEGKTEAELEAERERERLARLQFHKTGLKAGTWVAVLSNYPQRGYVGPLSLAQGEIRTGVSVPALQNSLVQGHVFGPNGETLQGRTTVIFTGSGPDSDARIAEEHERVIGHENDRSHCVRGGVRTQEGESSFERNDVPLGVPFKIVALHEDYQPLSVDLPSTVEGRTGLELRFVRRR